MGTRPKVPGSGRKVGSLNKTTAVLKDAILQAATMAGGKDGLVGYLLARAQDENKGPFVALLGKVLPLQVGSDPDNPLFPVTDTDRAEALVAFMMRTGMVKKD